MLFAHVLIVPHPLLPPQALAAQAEPSIQADNPQLLIAQALP